MSSKLKKILAILIMIVVLVGWYVSIFGVGSFNSVKDLLKFGLDINGGVYVVMEAETDLSGDALTETMEQTKEIINRRVNGLGIAEANVSIEGDKRIRIELPGVENAEEAIAAVGMTAQLKFLLADGTLVFTGEEVSDARVDTDPENGGRLITLTFTDEGTRKFTEASRKAFSGQVTSTNEGINDRAIMIMLDQTIVTAPVVQEVINTSRCNITNPNGFSFEEASTIAALIRGGALPVQLNEITTSVQTATIGADALQKSIIAGAIGLILIFLIMVLMYNVLGLMADIALALYVLIVVWAMVAMGAVLTLPGIAAIILSIGMAVDANVIIFSRIKEEIAKGKSTRVAVSEGFKQSITSVLDAQVTTLIAAIVLYLVGSTIVKGFAITLMIGIVVSIFTAVVVTQILVSLLAESGKFDDKKYYGVNADGTPKSFIKKEFVFIKKRKLFYAISVAFIVIGLAAGLIRGFNYGIDFTGGTMIQLDMGKTVDTEELKESIKSFDLNPTVVLAGDNREQVIIRTVKALENDERREVVAQIGEKYGITEENILASEQFGPTVGDELKGNAVRSIAIAAICMLIYIIIRFKTWKYGVSAVVGLAHDVLVMLAVYGLFNIIINNPFIAAILTVVGYSINDTIVIFDRIRENRELYKKNTLEQNLDLSINQTLSRSVMTSITTLLAMVPLVLMVSSSVREFVIPLMIGVLVGTFSSVFLTSPILYEFSKGEEKVSKYTGK
ncbi:MAG: protein translocase subunit SecD [Firmicutes bacterium]|nr:protein translocase subunit SecD [Bacillota bacterium]